MRLTPFGNCVQIAFIPRAFPVNCYFVKENDGLTLIDTALPFSAKAIQQAAQAMGMPISRILLTHAHGDHVGSLDLLHDLYPAAEVLISKRDSRLLKGDTSLDPDEPQSKIKGGIKPVRTQPTGYLEEGERYGSLEAICAPGHTPGQMAFLDVRDKALIAGDAFQVRGGIAVSGTIRPLFPFLAFATWHKPTALKSAKHLREFRPSRLAVGHGRVLTDPLDAMDYAIAKAEKILRD